MNAISSLAVIRQEFNFLNDSIIITSMKEKYIFLNININIIHKEEISVCVYDIHSNVVTLSNVEQY